MSRASDLVKEYFTTAGPCMPTALSRVRQGFPRKLQGVLGVPAEVVV